LKKFLSFALVLIILAVSSGVCYAEGSTNSNAVLDSADDYSTYLKNNKNLGTDVGEFYADVTAAVASDGAVVEVAGELAGKKSVLKWTNGDGGISFSFNVDKDGLYNIAVNYYMLESNTKAAELSLLVDGEEPFEGISNISLPRIFADDGKIRADGIGNEFAPEQKEVFNWQEKRITDFEGLNDKPYLFALKKGVHTVTFYESSSPFAISSLKLCAAEKTVSYKEKLQEYKEKGYKNYTGEQINIQGEEAYLKSAFNLISQSDATSANVTPYDAKAGKVNYIGGNNWSGAGDTISWKFNAPKDGLYSIVFAYQQSYIVNGSAYRVLRVDGEIPFSEAAEIDFNYCNSWKRKEFADKTGNPYLIYLSKGEHTLSLEVNLCCLSDFAIELKNQIYELGAIYREIVMITGDTPDANRDYSLFTQIPNLEERLSNCYSVLTSLINQADSLSEKGSSVNTSTLKNMVAVIKRMLDYKYQAQIYKSSFYDNYSSISAWLYEIISMIVQFALLYNSYTLAIPQYVIFSKLNMIDSYWVYILPYLPATLGVFLMKQFIDSSIPDALLEAGRIDGAGLFRIYRQIAFPIMKPAWLTLALFAFRDLWSMQPQGTIFSEELKMLPNVMSTISSGGIARSGSAMAATVILLIPPVILYLVTQGSVMQTMGSAGIKE